VTERLISTPLIFKGSVGHFMIEAPAMVAVVLRVVTEGIREGERNSKVEFHPYNLTMCLITVDKGEGSSLEPGIIPIAE
jgi:hypothetical protein